MDVIHCVIFVISAVDIYNDIPEAFVSKIGQLQDKLRLERMFVSCFGSIAYHIYISLAN
jgi:hypothetical protein